MKIFVLEDEIDRYPRNQIVEVLGKTHELTIARSFEEATRVWAGPYDLYLLDHDMHGYYENSDAPNTGYQFVKWLTEQENIGTKQAVLHSQNPVGRRNMLLHLSERQWTTQEVPFGKDYVAALRTL